MQSETPLIGRGKLTPDTLKGQVAIVTGAGGGIGYEAARALIWLGAHAVLAEVSAKMGSEAATRLNREMGAGTATFIQTDVGDERSVQHLAQQVTRTRGRVDIVLNNAAIEPLGAVKDVPIDKWDASYHVNLRGPVLMARAFLPGMCQRKCGIFVCVSSVGGPYMGAYEVLKAAQVAFANTLDAELEGTGVIAFTIGPGIVRTAAAEAGVKQIAPLMGKTEQEIYEMNKELLLSVEAAGASFAAAIALAPRFQGQEINGIAALVAAGIPIEREAARPSVCRLTDMEMEQALVLAQQVYRTLAEQSDGWKKRSVFERQWMLRDFRKNAGQSAEDWLAQLGRLEAALKGHDAEALTEPIPLEQLAAYYRHLLQVATGYLQNDPEKLKEQSQIVEGWEDEVKRLASALR